MCVVLEVCMSGANEFSNFLIIVKYTKVLDDPRMVPQANPRVSGLKSIVLL